MGPLLFLIYISDISEGISADTKIFVDDTKIKKSVNTESGVEELQGDLNKLYEWVKSNNMEFNGKKFQILRYGQNEDIKHDTLYFTEDMNDIIERQSTLRDLGIMLSESGTFDEHIDHVSKKVRQKMGWILRTFTTRDPQILKHLFKSLVIPNIDYCSQLYMPVQPKGIEKIEKLQMDYLKKNPYLKK